ncbi:MAG: hypothetical protein JWN51_855, partial [Phycisphaerales bacterium]|nr:hypothetical protein [Phycisphaerales bacterium]
GPEMTPVSDDPLPVQQRKALTFIAIAIIAIATGLGAGAVHGNPVVQGFFALLAMAGATFGITIGSTRLLPAVRNDVAVLQRLAVGGVALLCAVLGSLPVWSSASANAFPDVGSTLGAIAVCLLLVNWGRRQVPGRRQRINPELLIMAAVTALVVAIIVGANVPLVIGVIAGTSLAVEMAFPWSPSAAARRRREKVPVPQAAPVFRPVEPPPVVGMPVVQTAATVQTDATPHRSPVVLPGPVPRAAIGMPVHRDGRIIWLIGFVFCATLGLFLWALLTMAHSSQDERAMELGVGTVSLIAAGFCLRRSRMTVFPGWWAYFWRPVVSLAFILGIVLPLSFLMVGGVRGDDAAFAIFFLICSTVALFAMKFLVPRGELPRGGDMSAFSPNVPSSSFTPARGGFSPGKIVTGVGRFVLTLVGSVLLLAGVLVAAAVVVDLPGLFDSHLVDPDIHRGMRDTFGSADWPRLMREGATVASFLLTLIATVLLLAARRHRGAAHMLRAVVGVVALFFALSMLGRGLPEWADLAARPNGWEIVDQYLSHVVRRCALQAGLIAVSAIFMLMWPATRSRPQIVQSGAIVREANP